MKFRGGQRAASGRTEVPVIDSSDTLTPQSAAVRWTPYRRLGLLMRTCLDADGTTLSLHDIAARTHGRVSADELASLLQPGTSDDTDPVTYVLLAQAFDVDPDYFLTDDAVQDYIASIRSRYSALGLATSGVVSLQEQVYAIVTADALSNVAASR
jgi:hypothetical protein